MSFNPQTFQAAFSSGWARPALFEAWFAESPNIRFHITDVNIPGRTLVTDTFQHVPDMPRNQPISAAYNSVQFSVLLDANGAALNALHSLQNKAVTTFTSGANIVNYSNEYLTTFKIRQYKEDGSPIFTFTMQESYVASIGDVQLSWGATGQTSSVSCSINYKVYTVEGGGGGNTGGGSAGDAGDVATETVRPQAEPAPNPQLVPSPPTLS